MEVAIVDHQHNHRHAVNDGFIDRPTQQRAMTMDKSQIHHRPIMEVAIVDHQHNHRHAVNDDFIDRPTQQRAHDHGQVHNTSSTDHGSGHRGPPTQSSTCRERRFH